MVFIRTAAYCYLKPIVLVAQLPGHKSHSLFPHPCLLAYYSSVRGKDNHAVCSPSIGMSQLPGRLVVH